MYGKKDLMLNCICFQMFSVFGYVGKIIGESCCLQIMNMLFFSHSLGQDILGMGLIKAYRDKCRNKIS